MGHAVEYFTVKNRKDIMGVAENFAFRNTDREENPHGGYHGNMHIREDLIFENRAKAEEYIESYTDGRSYYDMAVRFKAKSKSLDKRLNALWDKYKKVENQMKEYDNAHSVRNLKSKLITCTECGSKINVHHPRFRGEECPLCRKDLRADYITEKIASFTKKMRDIRDEMETVKLNDKGSDKDLNWLVKVEVHC